MKASETALSQLLQGNQQFLVPLYQRTYSWSGNQLERLWSDIVEQADLLAEGDVETTHFLGSVVLAPSPQDEPIFRRWVVVDGQQRLTTLSLALAAIRDHVANDNDRQRDRINEQFLVNKFSDGDDHLRFLPTQADREAYDACVRAGHTSSGSDSVSNAYLFFRKKLVAIDDPADPHDISRIEQAITGRLSLVVITSGREDNVHRIFESLNNTGLKLSQADLLRNYLFMRMGQRGDQVYRAHWLPLQQLLTNEELEELMWLQLVLDGDDRVRRQDLYTAQQKRLDSVRAKPKDIERYVEQLHDRAEIYRPIIHPELEPDFEIRRYLERLQVWQATVTHPAVLLLLEKRARNVISETDVARALRFIESFLIRRMICGVPTNSLNKIFQSLPSQLPTDLPIHEAIHQVLSVKNRYWSTDRELTEAIRSKPFYKQWRGNQRRMILQRLEESFGHPEPVNFTNPALTIEHVLPQKPGQDWLEPMQDECEEGESVQELHARLVHTLGNLTLTGLNPQLSNHLFKRKQDILASSHLEMNKEIANTPRWGAQEIWARASALAARACKIWPAPMPNVEYVERERDWQPLHQILIALPHGTWTTYGQLAAVIGTSARAVGSHLRNTSGVVNAHRVLQANGKVAEGFKWLQEEHNADVPTLLAQDGINFTDDGSADPSQRLNYEDLGNLLRPETDT